MTQEESLKWVAGIFEEPVEGIQPETPRDDIPTWDSVGVLTLMAAMDEKFGIVLSDADMQGMTKVDDILAVLRRNGKLES